ncbi:hypothetical protein Tco_1166515 [Tanacetum coccineum]
MAEESSRSTMMKGNKVEVAETIEEEYNSLDTLGKEIDDYYEHKEDSEATQEEEGDDEVNKARTDDDDDEEEEEDKDEDDDESQFSLEAREKKNTPIPTPLDPLGLRHVITNINLATGTSIPMHTTHPTSFTSIVQPPSQTEPKIIRWDEDKPPTPPTSDDFIQSPHPGSDNQQPPLSPDKQVDAQEPYPPKTTEAPIVQPPLLQLDQELTNMHAILTMHYTKTLLIRQPPSSNLDKPLQDIPLEDINSEILTRMYTQPQPKTQHFRLLVELLKSRYHIQQLQQTCRGDALRKRPHDDHQDDDQYDKEKAKLVVQILESKMAQNDKETSQKSSTARNDGQQKDKVRVTQEFMGTGDRLSVSQPGKRTNKRWGHYYVSIYVIRADNLRYTITKVDLSMLELDDIEFLYLEQLDDDD